MSLFRYLLIVLSSLLIDSILGWPTVTQLTSTPIFASSRLIEVKVSGDGRIVIYGSISSNVGVIYVYRRRNNQLPVLVQILNSNDLSEYFGSTIAISFDGNTIVSGGAIDNNRIGGTWVFQYSIFTDTWVQQGSKLVGTGFVGRPFQGCYITLSGDGNTIALNGYGDNNYKGAVWIFIRSGNVWTQQGSKILDANYSAAYIYGSSVKLSYNGNHLVIGSSSNDTNHRGYISYFARSSGIWTQQGTKFSVNDTSYPAIGNIMDLDASGSTLVVGSVNADFGIGGIWVFERSGMVWTQATSVMYPSDMDSLMPSVGSSISISSNGDMFLVSSHRYNIFRGAHWRYEKNSNGIWVKTSNALSISNSEWGQVYYHVSMNNNGTFYVFGHSGGYHVYG